METSLGCLSGGRLTIDFHLEALGHLLQTFV
jgi:hypothetical protein